MNTKRIVFWACFVGIMGLIIWGLFTAMNKPLPSPTDGIGTPAPVSAGDHILGPIDAKVTLIEYGDFQCPACAVYAEMVDRLYMSASTTMRVVFRHFPLPQHEHAIAAALAAEAAASQGKFWDMYRRIYATQSSWQPLSTKDAEATFARYAREMSLDMSAYKAALADPAIRAGIQADTDESAQIGLSYTPTFFLNGKAIANPTTYEAFETLIISAAR